MPRQYLLAVPLMTLALSCSAQGTPTPRSLFFGENNTVQAVATAPSKPEPVMVVATIPKVQATGETPKKSGKKTARKNNNNSQFGASYFIRLQNSDGSTQDVLTSRKFKTGERFQLAVKINRPAYVYVLNEEPGGKISSLYPQPGHDNFVNAMGVVFLPGKGSFTFDPHPGIEHLLVFLSPTPVTGDPVNLVNTHQPDAISMLPEEMGVKCATVPVAAPQPAETDSKPVQLAALTPETTNRGIAFIPESECVTAPGNKIASASSTSRSIIIGDDQAPEGQGQATYVVRMDAKADSHLYLKIKLDHR